MSDSMNEPVERIVREVFGTVATIALVGRFDPAAIDALFARLDEIDARFSPYRPDSEISRLRDGVLARADLHPETAAILETCAALRAESGGRFDVEHAGRDGRLDPSGYVKGWAIGEAHRILRAGGSANCAVGIGGDVSASGAGPGGVGWVVGVADPTRPGYAVTRVLLRDSAIATSGQSERAGHLRDPRTGGPASSPWTSVTVVGPAIDRVDALATIGYLEGEGILERLAAHPGYEGLVLAADGRHQATPGFRALEV